jgi:hypothetical protein
MWIGGGWAKTYSIKSSSRSKISYAKEKSLKAAEGALQCVANLVCMVTGTVQHILKLQKLVR